ncbi:MAG: N-acetylmuramoyl-L-alanine amidase [Chloroflexota bacterium]
MPATRQCRVGVHGRNDHLYQGRDYDLVREAKIEAIKMMSFNPTHVFHQLRDVNPDLDFIVRLYDDRMHIGHHPTPAEFADRFIPIMQQLQPYATKFEVHNEPNHLEGKEGWGQEDGHARDFNAWFLEVYDRLKQACPWASLGFPGLAIPHRDLEWVDICRRAVERADWLGVHCYWQNPTYTENNHLADFWGLRFKYYHQKFPNKLIEITEFGNSNGQGGYPVDHGKHAQEYAAYYQELFKYPFILSASAFIMSAPQSEWEIFVWRLESGHFLPEVAAVRDIPRPPLVAPSVVIPAPVKPVIGEPVSKPPIEQPKPKPTPTPTPVKKQRHFPETDRTIQGTFFEFFEKYGLDICGYPITEQFEEAGLLSQYFQRLGLEVIDGSKIRLKLVGTEAYTSRQTIGQLQKRQTELEKEIAALQKSAEEQRRQPVVLPGGGVAPPAITDLTGSLPKHATKTFDTRPTSQIEYLIVHHTATRGDLSAERIARYQVEQQDRPGISYHFYLTGDGVVNQTHKLETVSMHAYDKSPVSVGIAFGGDFTNAVPTAAQLENGAQLLAYLLQQLGLSIDSIKGLKEFVPTHASPGQQWLDGKKWKDTLLSKVEALLASTPKPTPTPQPGEAVPLRIPQPNWQDVVTSLSRHPTKKYAARPLTAIEHIVVHHSAIPASVGAQRIAEYHVQNLGWPGIGYHFVIDDQGAIFRTNTLETIAYHAGNINGSGVGVCFLGNFTDQVPTPVQLESGGKLLAWLVQELKLTNNEIQGHKEFLNTQCPGHQWLEGQQWKRMLLARVEATQETFTQPVPVTDKAIGHYVLFYQMADGSWAEKDWLNARNYVAAFKPTCGFSVDDAMRARYVTIVGGPGGISEEAEGLLRAAGCQVERVAGKNEAETKKLLNDLAKSGKRFLTLPG